ncbi:hypothetical protein LA374_03825 [Aeromonas schubertii]|uniref:Lipoprotein n=1 Tax=Aeromonas schubertii TaxID=652 RepID=A0ABS7V7I4_9GAMM|nr:hypothetical protein [Aeromonas schubertii]MBZ6065342.1 hypothetical protein [Aeromonas schubertii]
MRYAIVFFTMGLGGCAMLGTVNTEPTPAVMAQRQVDSLHQLQLRMQYSNWLLGSHPQQREQERRRLKGESTLANRLNLAMVNSHPDEPAARRKEALATMERLLPETGLDEQAYLRTWLLLSRSRPQATGQEAEVARLRSQIRELEEKIAKLSAIDEQINSRKQGKG